MRTLVRMYACFNSLRVFSPPCRDVKRAPGCQAGCSLTLLAVQFSFAISLYHRFQKRARVKLFASRRDGCNDCDGKRGGGKVTVAVVATVALSVKGDDSDDEIRGVKAPSPSSPIVTGESHFTTSLIGVYRFSTPCNTRQRCSKTRYHCGKGYAEME